MYTIQHLPRSAQTFLRQAMRQYPELKSREGASMSCGVNRLAATWGRMKGCRHLIMVGSRKTNFSRTEDYDIYPARDHSLCHVVFKIGPWCVDLSARQFDPYAPYPLVQRFSDIKREWIDIVEYTYSTNDPITTTMRRHTTTHKQQNRRILVLEGLHK